MVRKKLQRAIKKAVKNLQEAGSFSKGGRVALRSDKKTTRYFGEIKIERPVRKEQGDYSTNIAMQVAVLINRKPETVAKIIISELKKDKNLYKILKDIQIASPGFINFYLSDNYLLDTLWLIFNNKDYGHNNLGKGVKLNLEFASINPTGELHVGHARAFFYGDVLANILQYSGYKVTREYYVNDAKESNQIKELGETALGRGTLYKTAYLSKKIKEYSKQLKRFKNSSQAGHFLAGKIKKDIEYVLMHDAGIKFDVWFLESDLYKNKEIEKILKNLERKKLVYKKDGALWIKTKESGDTQDQVLIRSNGEATYFLPDIAYHLNKKKRGFKKIIDVLGADHQGHAKRMNAVFKIFKIKNVDILISQMVSLRGGGKLSKRKGNIVTIKDLIDETGLNAVRFFYLQKSLNSQMEFDLKLAREQSQKNPVYYIQYTHARICSILRKTQNTANPVRVSIEEQNLNVLREEGELDLIRKLVAFPEIIENIAKDYQVHRLTTYLLELAQEFNQFYRDFRVINEDPLIDSAGLGQVKSINKARLALSIATGIIIKQSLDLLGISAPTKM